MMIHKKKKAQQQVMEWHTEGKAIQHELQLRHANMLACHERVVLSTQTPSNMESRLGYINYLLSLIHIDLIAETS